MLQGVWPSQAAVGQDRRSQDLRRWCCLVSGCCTMVRWERPGNLCIVFWGVAQSTLGSWFARLSLGCLGRAGRGLTWPRSYQTVSSTCLSLVWMAGCSVLGSEVYAAKPSKPSVLAGHKGWNCQSMSKHVKACQNTLTCWFHHGYM